MSEARVPPSGQDAALDAAFDALRRFVLAAQAMRNTFAAARQLPSGDTVVLSHLAAAGTLSAGELAQRSGLARSSATSVIDRLEQAGLVHRTIRPGDRRSLDIALTEDGHDAMRLSAAWTREALYDLGPDGLELFATQLDMLATSMNRRAGQLDDAVRPDSTH